MFNQLFEEKAAPPPPSDKREQLEMLKLQLEIRKLGRPAWQTTGFWTATFPIIISFGTLAVLYLNGTFDTRARMLELRKENLAWEVNTFEQRKQTLTNENHALQFKLMLHQRMLDTLSRKNAGKEKLLVNLRAAHEQAMELIRALALQDSLENASKYLFRLASPVRENPQPADIWSDTSSILKN